MNKHQRDNLTILFIIIFCFISPVIILYGYGYKINWRRLSLEQTAALTAESSPKNATILLNNRPQTSWLNAWWPQTNNYQKTPNKIKGLLPDTYTVTLQLDGYWPWERKISFAPGQSVYLKNTKLFRQSQPTLVSALNAKSQTKTLLSPDKNQLAILTDNNLLILNLTSGQFSTTTLPTTNQQSRADSADNFAWSPDSQQILVQTAVVSLATKKINQLPAIFVGRKLVWLNDSQRLLFLNKTQWFILSLNNNQSTQFLAVPNSQTVGDFFVKANQLYFVAQPAGQINQQLTLVDLSTKQSATSSLSAEEAGLNFFGDFSIKFSGDHLELYDTGRQRLFVQSNQTNAWSEAGNRVTNFIRTADGRLIYANNFELWQADPTFINEQLVNRLSQTIASLACYQDNQNLFYSTGDSIVLFDLDNRFGYYQSLKIMDGKNISDLQFNPNEDELYFLGNINNKFGLYRLAI